MILRVPLDLLILSQEVTVLYTIVHFHGLCCNLDRTDDEYKTQMHPLVNRLSNKFTKF